MDGLRGWELSFGNEVKLICENDVKSVRKAERKRAHLFRDGDEDHPRTGERCVEKGAGIFATQVNASSGRASSSQITSWQVGHSRPRRITRGRRILPTTPPVSSSACLTGWPA